MPVVFKHTPCPTCGHSHNFCLPAGDASEREFVYVCPETGKRAVLRPDGPSETTRHYPQGAVALTGTRAAAAA